LEELIAFMGKKKIDMKNVVGIACKA